MAAFNHVADQNALKALRGEIEAQGVRFGYKTHIRIAAKLGRSANTIGNWLRDPDSIRLGDLRNIIRLLRLDPAIVMAALGYTRTQIRNYEKEDTVYDQ